MIDLVSLLASNEVGQVANFDAEIDNNWVFVTTSSGISYGEGASIETSFAINTVGFQNTFNGTFGIAQIGNNLNLSYTVLPEPSAYTLLFGLFAIGLVGNRRQRN